VLKSRTCTTLLLSIMLFSAYQTDDFSSVVTTKFKIQVYIKAHTSRTKCFVTGSFCLTD